MIINLPDDYIDDLNIRMTHHSTALEGNTLTLDETRDLLLEGITPTRSVNIREIHEVTSNARALKEVIKSLKNNEPFSEMLILRMHYFIGESTVTFPGEYKKVNNFIVGSNFETTPANQVAYAMNEWIKSTREILKLNDKREFFKQLAKNHIEFEKIHPFSDGNGRCGRMIITYLSLYIGHLPPVIPSAQKKRYLDCLRSVDVESFGSWLLELSEVEDDRLRGFRGF